MVWVSRTCCHSLLTLFKTKIKIFIVERLCSAGLLPRVSSAASLDPSDESADSVGRLQIRCNSIPNNSCLQDNTYFGGSSLKKKLMPSSPRRLSIKEPSDSIC